ncbi:MAG TPA: class I SAM-dependent methyltransferase [Candidatus Thermoplasmatota archaeon]|nr:class I SAM-dependent methyltransferase [Candidatus Thermoplasmatota archaeon]
MAASPQKRHREEPSAKFHRNIFRRLASGVVKKTSNLFWEIADDWSYKNEKIARYYDRTIGGDYTREYNECGITPESKVLHIGCGAYPLTEMMLATHAHVHSVVGIDHNPLTVKRAGEVIQRKNLNGKITIEHGDGIDFPVDGFDVVIASSCSLPKQAILQHLFATTRSKCRIIVRELDIAADEILYCIRSHPEVKLEKCMHHNPFPFVEPMGWTTYCLRKQ